MEENLPEDDRAGKGETSGLRWSLAAKVFDGDDEVTVSLSGDGSSVIVERGGFMQEDFVFVEIPRAAVAKLLEAG